MSKPAYAISVETLTHSFVCLDDLVLPGRNYLEIIRDSIQELFPILRQGCFNLNSAVGARKYSVKLLVLIQ